MTAEEYIRWIAFDRVEPIGHPWDNFALASILRQLERLIPRKKGDKIPPLESFGFKPPEPLFYTREKKRAQRVRRSTEIRREG